ncbi:oxygenase MpaB family protein [Citricoccus nitrophenolicus]|uniref:Oxygenase MpaB family protein n=1 Tax=Citricoccus nitrophenolicus TaxID=863575 RepID=A0ABV0IKP0_9MICC|nr:oxygenase MpaB family protein [Citricoccus sp. I39-566]WMY78647.1 oxygenase MpaB family protein [Citricoccus sp. I39-566]
MTGGSRRGPTTTVELAREAVVLAGAGTAILLQVAHRPVGAGVARHSDFAADPLRRLRHTLQFVYAAVLPEAEPARARIAARVGAAHAPVRGTDAAGREYSAADPQAQLWVAATLYRAAEQSRRRIWGELEPEDAERIYRDYAVLGTLLGMPAALWPSDRAAFERYWAAAVVRLEVTEDARAITRDLFVAEHAPWWLRRLMPTVRFVTAGMLPAGIRAGLGLDWDGADSRREARLWAAVRAVYPRLPPGVRQLPSRLVVRTLRAGTMQG